jgi:hypothetical protein
LKTRCRNPSECRRFNVSLLNLSRQTYVISMTENLVKNVTVFVGDHGLHRESSRDEPVAVFALLPGL